MRSCAPTPALAANSIDRRLASRAPGLLQGRAVVAVVVLLLPSVNRSFESLAVPGPHRVDERVPGLALSGPFLVVSWAVACLMVFTNSASSSTRRTLPVARPSFIFALDQWSVQWGTGSHEDPGRIGGGPGRGCVACLVAMMNRASSCNPLRIG